jgi:hypothetical protein
MQYRHLTHTVNSTENQIYLGVSRSVNNLAALISTPDYNTSLTYVYDRSSGMLLQSTVETIQTQPESTTTKYAYSIIETNIFASAPTAIPTEFIVAVVIALIIIIAVSAALILRKRTSHH